MSKKHKHHHEPGPSPEPPHDTPAAAECAEEPLAAPTAEEVEALRTQAAEAVEWKNKYLYALADLDNYRKRAIKERSEHLKYAGQDILGELLDVVDNFDRALAADRNESDPRVIVDGIEIIYKQLVRVLERFEVKPIDSIGTLFDPTRHDAMQQIVTTDAPPGTVIEELQRGYTFRDRVLRPARVVVAGAPSATPSA
jgi:molecular chaperone GrpE